MLRGGQISQRGSIFSGDGRLLLVPCGHDVRVYAAATTELCSQLQGHTGEVTSIALNPEDGSQLYSASLDGTLRLWDISSGECLQVLPVNEAVRHMAVHAGLRMAYLAIEWRDGQSGRVITYHLGKGKAGSSAMKTRGAAPLAMNPQGSLAATIDRHSLFVWRVGPEISQPLNLHHTKPYTCVAISPDESIVAAGDASGRILLWRNVGPALPHPTRGGGHAAAKDGSSEAGAGGSSAGAGGATAMPVCTTVHWHSGPVGCLTFSPDGTYLRSGGREGVLVSWQLDNNQPHFLPRLGGALLGMTHCTSNPALLLLRQADNTLRVINLATNTVPTSVFGLRPAVPQLGPAANQLATCLQPGTSTLCVPAHNAMLQLYDTRHHRHVALLQVVPRNEVVTTNPGDDATTLTTPYVSHTAFTHDGSCLATVDVRPGAGPFDATESSLKFWDAQPQSRSRQPGSAPFSLNTLADEAHRGPVTCLAAHPSQELVVTAGGAATPLHHHSLQAHALAAGVPGATPAASHPEFKVWERVAVPRRPGSKVAQPTCWRCRSVASYKGLAFTAAAFSPDGSVLALAAGAKVTLWDPLSSTLAGVLPTPPELLSEDGPQPIMQLEFISGAPYLVGRSAGALVVWDLLACTVTWAAPLRCCSIVADPQQPRFAATVPIPHHLLQQQPHAAPAAAAADSAPGKVGSAGGPAPMDTDGPAEAGAGEEASQGGAQGAGVPVQRPAQEPASEGKGRKRGQQQQQQQQAGAARHPGRGSQAAPGGAAAARGVQGPCCCVLVFDPASPLPLLAARVPSAAHAQLLFGGGPSGRSGAGLSSLLVLTESRAYGYLQPEAGQEEKQEEEEGAAVAAAGVPEAPVSAFEAAFGLLPAAAQPAGAGAGEQAAGGSELRWRRLFDTPSHVLPPPSALASAFLRLLTEQ